MEVTPPDLAGWDFGTTRPRASVRRRQSGWANLYKAQQAGADLPPHVSSQHAARLPDPPYPTTSFPGHSAWIDGDWKLHRIQARKSDAVRWELYDLWHDREEQRDVAEANAERVQAMTGQLEAWLTSVAHSLNGADYR